METVNKQVALSLIRQALFAVAGAISLNSFLAPELLDQFVLGLAALFLTSAWSFWTKYKDRIFARALVKAGLEAPASTPPDVIVTRAQGLASLPTKTADLPKVLAVLMVLALVPACAGANRAPVLVGQAGLASAKTVGQLQQAAMTLERNGTLPTEAALQVQTQLLRVNEAVSELPDILRAIDAAQQLGNVPVAGDIERALHVIERIAADLSIVVAGVPVSDATKQLLELVRVTQQTITAVTVQLGQLKERTT